MRKIIILTVLWFLVLNFVNLITSKVIFDSTSYELPKNISISPRHLFVPWLNFDGRNYLDIVLYGYNHPGKLELRVFFPLFPILVRIFSFNLLFSPVLIGLGISVTAFVGGLMVFFALMKEERMTILDRQKTLLFLILFPTSYYFFAFYTESLFLLLALLTFYYLKKRHFLLASLFTALATATRITGLALIPPILYEAYLSYRKTRKIPLSTLTSPLGLVAFGLYINLISGNAYSIIQDQKNWNRPVGLFGPFYAIRDGFIHAVIGSPLGQRDFRIHFIEQVEFMTAVLLIVFLFVSFRKLKLSYWLYVFFSAVIMFCGGILSSFPRYVIVLFPIYMYLTMVIKKKIFFLAICAIFIILSLVFSAMFLRGYWVA